MQKLIFRNSKGVEINLTEGNYFVVNWSGLSNVGQEIQTQKVPFVDGSVYLDNLLNERELSFTVALNDEKDLAKRYELRRELISVLNSKLGEGYLIYENDYLKKQIKVVPDAPIIPNKNFDEGGTIKCELVFTALNPYWEDMEETIVSIDNDGNASVLNVGDIPVNDIEIKISSDNCDEIRLINTTNDNSIVLGNVNGDIKITTGRGNKKAEKEHYTVDIFKNLGFATYLEEVHGIIFETGNVSMYSADGKKWKILPFVCSKVYYINGLYYLFEKKGDINYYYTSTDLSSFTKVVTGYNFDWSRTTTKYNNTIYLLLRDNYLLYNVMTGTTINLPHRGDKYTDISSSDEYIYLSYKAKEPSYCYTSDLINFTDALTGAESCYANNNLVVEKYPNDDNKCYYNGELITTIHGDIEISTVYYDRLNGYIYFETFLRDAVMIKEKIKDDIYISDYPYNYLLGGYRIVIACYSELYGCTILADVNSSVFGEFRDDKFSLINGINNRTSRINAITYLPKINKFVIMQGSIGGDTLELYTTSDFETFVSEVYRSGVKEVTFYEGYITVGGRATDDLVNYREGITTSSSGTISTSLVLYVDDDVIISKNNVKFNDLPLITLDRELKSVTRKGNVFYCSTATKIYSTEDFVSFTEICNGNYIYYAKEKDLFILVESGTVYTTGNFITLSERTIDSDIRRIIFSRASKKYYVCYDNKVLITYDFIKFSELYTGKILTIKEAEEDELLGEVAQTSRIEGVENIISKVKTNLNFDLELGDNIIRLISIGENANATANLSFKNKYIGV